MSRNTVQVLRPKDAPEASLRTGSLVDLVGIQFVVFEPSYFNPLSRDNNRRYDALSIELDRPGHQTRELGMALEECVSRPQIQASVFHQLAQTKDIVSAIFLAYLRLGVLELIVTKIADIALRYAASRRSFSAASPKGGVSQPRKRFHKEGLNVFLSQCSLSHAKPRLNQIAHGADYLTS